jgi:hypothetical protein
MVQLEGLGKLKSPMTSSVIENATFQLVGTIHNYTNSVYGHVSLAVAL